MRITQIIFTAFTLIKYASQFLMYTANDENRVLYTDLKPSIKNELQIEIQPNKIEIRPFIAYWGLWIVVYQMVVKGC